MITFEQRDGTIFDVHSLWEGVKYSRYRNISINDDLKLFHISEERKKIFIFTEPDSIEDRQPYKTFTFDTPNLDDEILDIKMSIKLGSRSGNVPKKPLLITIKDVMNEAKDGP